MVSSRSSRPRIKFSARATNVNGTGSERAIVSAVAGTTRDAVDETVRHSGIDYVFVDTAGIRRKGKTKLMAEKLSVVMARRHIRMANVVLLILDASEGVVGLDATIAGYAHEAGREIPIEPMISIKPATAVIGPGDGIVYPKSSTRVDPEAELGVVIGRRAHRVPPDRAGEYILGYTCFNDVTARDLQRRDTQWTRGKGFDTFAPIGPWIIPELHRNDLEVRCLVNGEVRQRSNTSLMLFPVNVLVSFISHVMTLLPGDVIASGTPEGIAPMQIGDEVAVEVEGIGTLANRVVAE